MNVGVSGDPTGVKKLIQFLGLCPCVSNRAPAKGGWAGSLRFEAEEEVDDEDLEAAVTVLPGKPPNAHAMVYILSGTADECSALAAAQTGPKQAPFAVVLSTDSPSEAYDEWEQRFNESRFFLGTFPASSEEELEGLWWSLYHAVEHPAHVLWDRPQGNFTSVGWRAVQRLFWWYDEDKDGALDDAEFANLLTATRAVEVSEEEVEETRHAIEEQQAQLKISNFVSLAGHLTNYAILSLCESWLAAADHEDYWQRLRGLWKALRETGIHTANGNPWSPSDLEHIELDPVSEMLQLSFCGVEFLSGIYDGAPTPHDLWKFTPSTQMTSAGEPPWAYVSGLPGSREHPAPYTKEAFVSSWRFITVCKHQHLVVFARCWGYDDDPNRLFVRKKKREYRKTDEELPNVLQCLLLGSPRCGKTSLRRRLASSENCTHAEDGYEPTKEHSISLVPRSTGTEENDLFDLVLHEIPDKLVATLLKDKTFMSHIDAVLLSYDGDDVYSFSYVAEKYPLVARLKKMPALLVMTKVDLLGNGLSALQDQEYSVQPHEFAKERCLCWPPAMVSCYAPSASLKEVNDIDDLPVSIAMLCRYPDDYIGKESRSLCCRIGKLCALTSVLAGAAAGVYSLTRRQ